MGLLLPKPNGILLVSPPRENHTSSVQTDGALCSVFRSLTTTQNHSQETQEAHEACVSDTHRTRHEEIGDGAGPALHRRTPAQVGPAGGGRAEQILHQLYQVRERERGGRRERGRERERERERGRERERERERERDRGGKERMGRKSERGREGVGEREGERERERERAVCQRKIEREAERRRSGYESEGESAKV